MSNINSIQKFIFEYLKMKNISIDVDIQNNLEKYKLMKQNETFSDFHLQRLQFFSYIQ